MNDQITVEAETANLLDTRAEQAVATVQRGGELSVPLSTEGAAIRSAMLALAANKDFDVAKLEALNNLQNGVEDRQAERAFNRALVQMKPHIPIVKRDGRLEYPVKKDEPEGPKKLIAKYAKWEDIEAAITPILHQFGFAMSHKVTPRPGDGGGLMVSCVLRHEEGHTEVGDPIPVPLDTSGGKNNIQAYGSAVSYGQRYSAKAMGLIRTEGDDDDGVAAGGMPLSFDEAAQIKKLVSEAGIGEGKSEDDRRAEVIEWFNDFLGYPLVKGYISIRKEDSTRVQRALLSLKAKRLTSREREASI